MRCRALLSTLLIGSCGGPASPRGVTSLASSSQASSQQLRTELATDGECMQVAIIEGGVDKGTVCASVALAKGMTIVDLTDTWTPTLLAPADGHTPSFHDRYLALANEHDLEGHPIEGEDA